MPLAFSAAAAILLAHLDLANMLKFVVALHNLHFNIILDRHESQPVFLSQLFGKKEKHNFLAGYEFELYEMAFSQVRSHIGIALYFSPYCSSNECKRKRGDGQIEFVRILILAYLKLVTYISGASPSIKRGMCTDRCGYNERKK